MIDTVTVGRNLLAIIVIGQNERRGWARFLSLDYSHPPPLNTLLIRTATFLSSFAEPQPRYGKLLRLVALIVFDFTHYSSIPFHNGTSTSCLNAIGPAHDSPCPDIAVG